MDGSLPSWAHTLASSGSDGIPWCKMVAWFCWILLGPPLDMSVEVTVWITQIWLEPLWMPTVTWKLLTMTHWESSDNTWPGFNKMTLEIKMIILPKWYVDQTVILGKQIHAYSASWILMGNSCKHKKQNFMINAYSLKMLILTSQKHIKNIYR